MYCLKCGAQLPDDARFCPVCGTPVEQVPAPRRLEDPIEPLAGGAVPPVPLAPPPRATRIPDGRHRGPGRRTTPSRREVPLSSLDPSMSAWPGAATPLASQPGPATAPVTEPGPGPASATAPEPPAAGPDDAPADETRVLLGSDEAAAAVATRPADAPGSDTSGTAVALGPAPLSPTPASGDTAPSRVVAPRPDVAAPKPRRHRSRAGVAVVLVAAIVALGVVVATASGVLGSAHDDGPRVEPPSDGSVAPIQQPSEPAGDDQPDVPVRERVADYSWDELSQLADQIAAAPDQPARIEIARRHHLCAQDGTLDGTQAKDVTLSDGTTVTLRVAGFGQDLLADGSGVAGISLVASTPVGARAINDVDAVVPWGQCGLRAWLDQTLLPKLPDDLREAVATVGKQTNLPAQTPAEQGPAASGSDSAAPAAAAVTQERTEDRLWVPSYSEVAGAPTSANKRAGVYRVEGEQYQLFSDAGVSDYQPNAATALGDGAYWWLRSPDVSNARWYLCVQPDGTPTYGNRPGSQNQVLFGLCL